MANKSFWEWIKEAWKRGKKTAEKVKEEKK